VSGEIRVVWPQERDKGTTRTARMQREAGVASSTAGAEKIWVGYVTMQFALSREETGWRLLHAVA